VNEESRYARAALQQAPAHRYDANGFTVKDVDINGKEVDRDKVEYHETYYLLTTLPLPDPPDVQVMVRETDNVALLAHKALKDPQKWWVVADANPQIRHPLDYRAGDVVFLPV
jgi:hypothetical protein